MMGARVLIFFIIIFLICVGIYYFVNQTNVHDLIGQSIEEQSETLPNHQEETNNEHVLSHQEGSQEEADEQVTEKITSAVKNTVDFIFKKQFHIVGIGDSLTQGVGDETKSGGYIGILDDTINHNHEMISFENFGKRGSRTDQLLKRLDEPEVSTALKGADIVLITIGANDIMQVVKENFTNLTYPLFIEEQAEFEERLHQIFQKIKTLNPRTEIYLLGLYNPFEQYFQDIEELDLIVNSWNQTGIDITNEYEGITFIPVKDLFDDTDVHLFAEDNFHPNLRGYGRIAKRVLTYLTDAAER